MERWEPNYGGSAGAHLAQQKACEHPWNRRLTSEHRRMYCGDCDVSFEAWAPADPKLLAKLEAAEAGMDILRGLAAAFNCQCHLMPKGAKCVKCQSEKLLAAWDKATR